MVAVARTVPTTSKREGGRRLSDAIALSEIRTAGLRFEAGTFDIRARASRAQLTASGYRLAPLFGKCGIATSAHNAFRFRRIFVEAGSGVPFLSSSEINSIRPRVERWLSSKLTKKLEELLIRPHDVLISCSGSIGNIGFAGRRLAGMALSQDAIRVRVADEVGAGFIAAFLRTRFGRDQLRSVTYGSVIVHIEPAHLSRVYVPDVGAEARRRIGRAILDVTEKRDEANELIDVAIASVGEVAGLPPFAAIGGRGKTRVSRVRASRLDGRFDGRFHDPVALAVVSALGQRRIDVVPLRDSRYTKEIRPITRFRKRTYVKEGGIPLLSSKQLFQIDPVDVKRLAKGAHVKDLGEIALKPHMLAITRSGTVGRVQMVPEYMNGWAASEHATRLIPASRLRGAFVFAWLSSEYGQSVVRRHSYGSVVPEIDKGMIGSVPVPVVPTEAEREIGDAVLRANRLRDKAWREEQDAIDDLIARICYRPEPQWLGRGAGAEQGA